MRRHELYLLQLQRNYIQIIKYSRNRELNSSYGIRLGSMNGYRSALIALCLRFSMIVTVSGLPALRA